jgi:tRNA(adenine34) deaminase
MAARDDLFMLAALDEARAAGMGGDVPVGAIIVRGDEIIARGHNRRQASADPTAHAEIEALRMASRQLGSWHIEGTMYVTQEPCPMCAGALVNARVERLVYGCANPKAGAVHTLYRLTADKRLNHRIQVMGGVRQEECAELLRSFFAQIRAEPRLPRSTGKA